MGPLDPPAAGPRELEDRLLPWSQVRVISGLSRTTIWRLQKTGNFPASVQVSLNRVGWWQSEILEWKRSRTPRRLPEAKTVPAPIAVAAPSPPPALAVPARRAPSDASQEVAAPATRRRRAAVLPGQGAFDF